MIKHIVMWKVRGDTAAERQASAKFVKTHFESLVGRIPGLLRMEIGLNFSGVDYACDMVLYSEFDSVASLEDYASHPEHLRIRQAIGDLRIARFQVDYMPEAA